MLLDVKMFSGDNF